MHRRMKVDMGAADLNKDVLNMKGGGFFRHGSPYLAHPLLTAERTRSEIDYLETIWDLPQGAQILDVGCGFGRHSVELARRGYGVVGIDSSEAMIDAARELAEDAAVTVDFRRARGQDYSTQLRFDAAVCLFTTLGQIDEGGENRTLVSRAAALLKPGGWFIVEVPQREATLELLRPSDRFGDENDYTIVKRRYDAGSESICEEFRVVSGEKTDNYLLHYHLFTKDELLGLLAASNLHVQQVMAAYSGKPLSAKDPMMLIVARKNV